MQPLLGERSLWLLLNSRHCSRAKFKRALVVDFVVPSPAENRCFYKTKQFVFKIIDQRCKAQDKYSVQH